MKDTRWPLVDKPLKPGCVMPGLPLPVQPQSVTSHWPVLNHTGQQRWEQQGEQATNHFFDWKMAIKTACLVRNWVLHLVVKAKRDGSAAGAWIHCSLMPCFSFVCKFTLLNVFILFRLENVAVARQCISILRASLQAVQLVLCESFKGSETTNIR